MRNRILITMLMTPIFALWVCGCAGMGKGPSDEELVAKVLADWTAAAQAKDLDKIMAVYSEAYSDGENTSKAAAREFMQGAIEQNYLEGLQVDLEQAKTTLENGTATITPVDLSSNAGFMSVTFELKKEADGAWRITKLGEY